jgi:HYR domain-containing protein
VDERTVEGNTTGGWSLDFSAIGSASDAEDGTPSVSCDPATGTTLPLGTSTVSCTASDSGGQSASDTGSVTVVDTTAPAIACPADLSGIVGQNIALGAPTATDIVDADLDISNNAPASFAAGSTIVQWAAADDSGNAASCTQHVTLAYTFLGFFQPVENPGPNNDVLNQAKAGRVIPLKWRLLDANNNPVTDLASSAVKVTAASYSCGLGTTVDQLQEYAAGASGLQNQGDGYYQFNWRTPSSYANSCKTMQLSLGEGAIVHTALFKFTK